MSLGTATPCTSFSTSRGARRVLAGTIAACTVIVRGAYTGRIFHLPQLKILWAVVSSASVLVMDTLVGLQVPAEDTFHDKDVLKDVRISRLRPGVIWRPHANVALMESSSALPVRRGLGAIVPTAGSSTSLGAVLAAPVSAPILAFAVLASAN